MNKDREFKKGDEVRVAITVAYEGVKKGDIITLENRFSSDSFNFDKGDKVIYDAEIEHIEATEDKYQKLAELMESSYGQTVSENEMDDIIRAGAIIKSAEEKETVYVAVCDIDTGRYRINKGEQFIIIECDHEDFTIEKLNEEGDLKALRNVFFQFFKEVTR